MVTVEKDVSVCGHLYTQKFPRFISGVRVCVRACTCVGMHTHRANFHSVFHKARRLLVLWGSSHCLHGEPFCPDQHVMGERVKPNLGKTQLLNQDSLRL